MSKCSDKSRIEHKKAQQNAGHNLLLRQGYALTLSFVFFTLCGRDFPKDPLKIFPFFVFLSPLPIG
jgi:hypothetical protein